MKFVCVADESIQDVDDRENRIRVRVPRPINAGDVVSVILQSNSTDPVGNPRKELRIYSMPSDPTKVAPRYHIGSIQRGQDCIFELGDFGLVIYQQDAFTPFLKIRTLLAQPEIDAVEVFAEFDKAIF